MANRSDSSSAHESAIYGVEHLLLILFLCCQVWHFRTQAGQISGFDAGDFLFRVGATVKGDWDPPLRSSFWAYHPPLAFLLARWAQYLPGVNDVISVQIVSKASFLIAFFAFRATLRHLRLLSSLPGIVLLYVAFSVPLMVHASVSLNMDILVLACAMVVLLTSVRLWGPERSEKDRRLLWSGILIGGLTVSLFVKYSGLLIAVIPLLVAFQEKREFRPRRHRVALAAVLIGSALFLATPYYYTRYYVATGSFFPNVNEWWYPDELKTVRAARDADRVAFLVSLFQPSAAIQNEMGTARDMAHARLVDSWRDLYFKDPMLGQTSRWAVQIGRFYAYLVGLGMVGGSLALWQRWRRRETSESGNWLYFGNILLPFGAMLFLALIAFIYQQPIAAYIPGKCLYILPITISIAYLIASLLPMAKEQRTRWILIPTVLTAVFLLLNFLLPVY